jgi:replication fork protection complex subunit Tof1/Swi1
MSSADIADPQLKEAADVLQQQIIYNGESLRSYKPGTQSLAYLDSSVYLSYALMRMLERWGKSRGEAMYVRKQKKLKKKRGGKGYFRIIFSSSLRAHRGFPGVGEEDGIPDVEEEVEEVEETIHETMFTFEAFEMVIIIPSFALALEFNFPFTEICAR